MLMHKIKVWDLPIRLFHWLLVITLVSQYITSEVLDDAMQWHFYGGYFCLALLLFRLLWGMIGSYYARFSQFLVSPTKAISYLRNSSSPVYVGHNPAGAYSVILLLSLVLTQAISGLFLSDEIFYDAPYFGVLDDTWQGAVNFIHHELFNIILAAIVLHILAIIYYKVKRKQHLTRAMFTGNKNLIDNKNTVISVKTNWLLFLVAVAVVGIFVYLVVSVLAPSPVYDIYDY